MSKRIVLAALLALVPMQFSLGWAQSAGEHWVATWTTAQDLARNPTPAVPPVATPPAAAPATPPAAPRPVPPGMRGFTNQTVRMIVHTSIGGNRVRIKLASAFGSGLVNVGAAHIAVRAKDSEIVAGTDRALTFSGKPGCVLGPGMVLISDPVDLKIPALSDLAVSLYLPGETGRPTTHGSALHTNYISKEGDFTGQAALTDAATSQAYFWLAGVDVMAPANAGLIVALGDSITDGIRSTEDTDHSWPALLAARLAARKDTANIAVGNMGISGNKVLRDGAGVSVLARFDRDVLSQSGVKWVMLLEGINDIGTGRPTDPVTVDEITGAYRQMIESAHTHGIKVIGCTLTPFLGAPYKREAGEPIRVGVNEWIRTSKAFDAVVDFDAAVRDPKEPTKVRAEFDPGDHLHPNNSGYEAMANAIDLTLFRQ
jgi:lysophospholipase L1-like esterase